MVHQELEEKSQTGFSRVFRLGGFFLSLGTLYLMVVWTLELSQVKVGDLPVVRALEADFKRKAPVVDQEIIQNSDLSINALQGNDNLGEDNIGVVLGVIEEKLTSEETPVPLSMKEALESSINEALGRLTKNEIISEESIYQVYVGSFDSHDAALETLEVINKIGSPAISEVFTVVSGIFGSRKSFRLETIRGFSYEKAKQYCDELVSYNLECKVISG